MKATEDYNADEVTW